MRHMIWPVLLAFGLGGCLGQRMGETPEPEVIRVPKTEVIREPAPSPEEVQIFPESCIRAMSYADTIVRSAEQIYDSGSDQLSIISDARKALADNAALSALEVRQRNLHGKIVGSLFSLEEALVRFERENPQCKKELE